jgi:hypothetical protein
MAIKDHTYNIPNNYCDTATSRRLLQFDCGDTIEVKSDEETHKGIFVMHYWNEIFIYESDKIFYSDPDTGLFIRIQTGYKRLEISTTRMVLTEKYIIEKKYPIGSGGDIILRENYLEMLEARKQYREQW